MGTGGKKYNNTGTIIGWNNPAGTEYTAFTSNDITKYPNTTAVTARWLNKDGKQGIDYANGSTTGFAEVSGVTVNKVNPTATFPTSTQITYGAALSTSELSGGTGTGTFAWTAPSTIPTVTNSGYNVTFTPTDAENYNILTQTVAITVNKASGTFVSTSALSTTYTPTLKLSDVTPPTNYAWTTPTTTLNAGNNQTFPATYTDPSGNYLAASGTITVNVAKAAGSFGSPSPLSKTYETGLKLSDVTPPANYVWTAPTTQLSAGNQQFDATYTDPSGNYNPVSGKITVNVAKASGLQSTAPPSHQISASNSNEHTYSLSNISLNKDDHGEKSYSLGAFTDNSNILKAKPTLASDGITLSYTGNNKTSGTATLVINITSQNYTDITTTITFEASAKQEVTISVTQAATPYTYDGTPKSGYTGKPTAPSYTGTFVYKYAGTGIEGTTTTEPTDVGEYTLTISLPDEALYIGGWDGTFKIERANPTVTWPTSATITYGQTLANAVFAGQSGTGTFAYTNGAATSPTVAQSGTPYQVTFTPTDTKNYNTLTQNVNITVNKAAGEFVTPAAVSATFSPTLKLSDISLSAGYAWVNGTSIALSAGDGQSFDATYTNPDDNHTTAEGKITVNIAKATTGLTATPISNILISTSNTAQTTSNLSSYISLSNSHYGKIISYSPGAFTDVGGGNNILTAQPTIDGTTIKYTGTGKTSGTATQVITITTQNYEDISVTLTFEATNKTQVTITGLTKQDYVYDNTAKSGVTGTVITTTASGTYDKAGLLYTYTGDGITGTTTDQPKNAGTYSLTVSVPTTDPAYFGSATYSFTIAKANPAYTLPAGLTATVGQTLANVTLPANWTWKEPPTTPVGTAGTQTHKATYTPTDQANYNVLTDIDVSITVKAAETDTDPIRNTQLASRTLKVQTIGNYIVLENLPQNARVEVYNLQGKLMHSSYSANSQTLRIQMQTKGMYIVKIK